MSFRTWRHAFRASDLSFRAAGKKAFSTAQLVNLLLNDDEQTTDSSPAARNDNLVERLDRLLPQTQCGQCGFDGCRPYAEAMADGEADIDRCPPGGDAGARALATLRGVPAKPYDRGRGTYKPAAVALVVEADCIGCTKCIQACPVDAIIGGSKWMHTVIEPLCTGCELCVPACPVDCIEMLLL